MAVQGSLFGHSERRDLGRGAWIELRSDWVDEPDALFADLMTAVPWRAERRTMYDRVLDVPRLVSFCDLTAGPPLHPAITRLRRRLNDIYAGELGEPFTTAGSPVPGRVRQRRLARRHDRPRRHRQHHGRRRQPGRHPRVRDAPGRRRTSLRLPQNHGDLLVMGGSCQRTWEHSVPKTSAPTGPRISIQFRVRGALERDQLRIAFTPAISRSRARWTFTGATGLSGSTSGFAETITW